MGGGAELLTLFGTLTDPRAGAAILDTPLLSVLRDTLDDSDPAAHRLRYAWILTSTRPTPWQRAASAISFLWFRAGGKHHAKEVPSPALDLAHPSRAVWPNLLANGIQATQFDPLGMAIRASTRSYRGNSSDYRKVQIFQALSSLEGLERQGGSQDVLPDSELRELYARLSLSDRMLGGLVRQKNLSRFYDKEATRVEQTRGHNWELLRQRAEMSGLYFEPLALPENTASQAMLWVLREDLDRRAGQRFDPQFLNIANPWTDERLQHWTGYSEVRYLDASGRLVAENTPGAERVEMIPLGLYSLDHPRAPLLMVDFRNTMRPKRRELLRHGMTTLLTGVFGITRFGNWSYFAADYAWNFVRARHGAAVNRSARLRAYSAAREFLAMDVQLNPKLKSELLVRLDHLAVNPLENGISTEARVAGEQYAALLRYAKSPDGLAARLEREHRGELRAYTESPGRRMVGDLGRLFRRGGASGNDPELRADLSAFRRAAYHRRFLEQLLASSPQPDVVWSGELIRKSVEALSEDPAGDPKSAELISQVFARSGDPVLRVACLRALQRSSVELAHNELLKLSQDPNMPENWRALCLLYYRGEQAPVQMASPGGGQ